MTLYTVTTAASVDRKLDRVIDYILWNYGTDAASHWLDDYEETLRQIRVVAGSYPRCTQEPLHTMGLKRINFRRHEIWFLYFSVDGDTATVEYLGNDLEDPGALWRD